jgi:hypothetical protein
VRGTESSHGMREPRVAGAGRGVSGCPFPCHHASMSSDVAVHVSALAINVTIPEALRWTDTRRGEEFLLTTLNVRLLPDGHLAAKAYGRPTAGGRGTYVSFPVPAEEDLSALVSEAASRAGELWTAHRGLD